MTKKLSNPYVGPRPFRPDESDRFFGREREAQELLSLVKSKRLVLFYAPSGAGKSSLINTSLIPGLEQGGFQVLPIGRVGTAFQKEVDGVDNVFVYNLLLSLSQDQDLTEDLTHTTLTDYLKNQKPEPPVIEKGEDEEDYYDIPARVLIIDQFEEIITTHLEHWQERAGFFHQLNRAMADDPLLWVVLTLREDYVVNLDPYAHLMASKLRTRFYIQRMSQKAALDAIKNPAENAGCPFNSEAAELLVANLRQIRIYDHKEGQLGEFVEPVQLQVVCDQLWKSLVDDHKEEINIDDLTEIAGGEDLSLFVDKALAQFYEQTIDKVLSKPELAITEYELRDWFSRRLITDAKTRGFVYLGTHQANGLPNEAVQFFADQYLIRAESKAGATWIELAHDRLIDPVLQSNQIWLEQNPIIRDAEIWLEYNRDPDRLYRKQQLETVLATVSDREALGPSVEEFLNKSEIAITERRKKEAKRQRELLEAKRAARRRLWLGIAFLILALLAFGAFISAFHQKRQTQRQGQTIEAMRLASTAKNYLDSQPDLALLLSLEAISRGENVVEARGSLLEGLISQPSHPLDRALEGHDNYVNSIVFSPDGQILASGSDDGTIILWDVSSPDTQDQIIDNQALEPEFNYPNPVKSVAFSSDGKFLVSGHDDGTIIPWDAITKEPIGSPFLKHQAAVNSLAFSPTDGDYTLASGSADQTVVLWNANTREKIHILSGHNSSVRSVAFSPDGQILASSGDDLRIILWDTRTGEEIQQLPTQEAFVQCLAFSPDGQILASGGSDGKVILWKVNTWWTWLWRITGWGISIEPRVELTLADQAHQSSAASNEYNNDIDNVFSLAFSSDGKTLASGYSDGKIILWDTDSGREIGALGSPVTNIRGAVYSLALSPNRKMLASAGANSRIILQDLDLKSWKGHACRLAHRNLTWSEWQKYLEPHSIKQFLPTRMWLTELGLNYQMTCEDFPVHESVIEEGIKKVRTFEAERNIDGAIAWFEQILELDPTIDIEPKVEVAQALIDLGREAVEIGDPQRAERLFTQALDLNPNLNRDFKEEIASGLANLGKKSARNGDIEGALLHFQQALEHDPTLELTPEAEIAWILLERDREFLAVGDIESSRTLFQDALKLYPNLELHLEAEMAQRRLIWGEKLATQGQIEEAKNAFDEAKNLAPDLEVSAFSWNILCRYGSVGGEAEAVKEACEKAVVLVPDDGWYHHDRGVARALTQDYKGAIEDFSFFLSWLKENGNYDQYGTELQAWIDKLEARQNPFDPVTLEKLRGNLIRDNL